MTFLSQHTHVDLRAVRLPGVAALNSLRRYPSGIVFLDLLGSSIDGRKMAKRQRHQLLTTAEAAEKLRLKKHTLENMRWQGTGPPFRKHGGRVFYHRADLKKWSDQTRRRSSSGEKL